MKKNISIWILIASLYAFISFKAPSALASKGFIETCADYLWSVTKVLKDPIYALKYQWARLTRPKEVKNFNYKAFIQEKEKYLSLLKNQNLTLYKEQLPATFEGKVAYIEALNELLSGSEQAITKNLILKSDYIKQKKLARVLKKINFNEKISSYKLNKVLAEMYEIAFGDPLSVKYLARHGISNSANLYLAEIVKTKMMHEGLVKTLKEVGKIKNPNIIERAKKILFSKELKALFDISMNAIILTSSGIKIPIAPRIKILEWKKIDKKLYEKAMNEGFSAIESDLAKHYLSYAKFDVTYDTVSKIYNIFTVVAFTYLSYEVYKKIKEEQEIKMNEDLEKEWDEFEKRMSNKSQSDSAKVGTTTSDEDNKISDEDNGTNQLVVPDSLKNFFLDSIKKETGLEFDKNLVFSQ